MDETVTQGIDDLDIRCQKYYKAGARFAKWRAVLKIDEQNNLPSDLSIHENAVSLARYASICQNNGLVPIVEPEVLMDGPHDINKCFEVTNITQSILFEALDKLDVNFSGIILKPNMVTSGSSCKTQSSAEEIAELTIKSLENNDLSRLSDAEIDAIFSQNLNSGSYYMELKNGKKITLICFFIKI